MNVNNTMSQKPKGDSINLTDEQQMACYRELGLTLNQQNPWADRAQLQKIFFEYLKYPSTDLAILHQQCDRLGVGDLLVPQDGPNSSKVLVQQQILQVCPCCGFKRQAATIPLCQSLDFVSGMGSSTILFFETMKNGVWLMLIAGFVYSISSIFTSLSLVSDKCNSILACDIISISLGPKQTTKTPESDQLYIIQSWFGVALVIAWGIWFLVMNYRERKIQTWTDRIDVSASDFTVLFQRLPLEINQAALQQILDQYHYEIDPNNLKEPFQIVTFNVAEPFYMREQEFEDYSLQILRRERDLRQEQLRRWLYARVLGGRGMYFLVNEQQRQMRYNEFDNLKKLIKERIKQLIAKLKEKYKENHQHKVTNTVFVTFRYSGAQHVITRNNSSSIMRRLRACLLGKALKHLTTIKGITIHRAPQPEDVNWSNVGVPFRKIVFRKFLTFFAAFAMIGITFIVMYTLIRSKKSHKSNRSVSISISVAITIINNLVGIVIRKLTAYERNYTQIITQRSQAVKTIVSQIINMVVLNFVISGLIEKNFHNPGGLTERVFYMATTNAILSPIMKFIDWKQIFRIFRRCQRENIDNKLYQTQKELNQVYEGKRFQVGDQYIYPIKTCVFTCFYLSLQPVIAFISAFGMIVMYWVDKFIMLKRSKRPPPGSDIVHHSMLQLIYLCPLFFCLGEIVWPIFIPDQYDRTFILPNMVGIISSLIIFLIPMELIFDLLVRDPYDHLFYDDQRVHFSAEYDRKNPATKKKAEHNYRQYLEDLKKKLEADTQKSAQDKQQLFQLIEANKQMASVPYAQDIDMLPTDELLNNQFDDFLIQLGNQGVFTGVVPVQTGVSYPYNPVQSGVTYPYNAMNNMGFTQPQYPYTTADQNGFMPLQPLRQALNPRIGTSMR